MLEQSTTVLIFVLAFLTKFLWEWEHGQKTEEDEGHAHLSYLSKIQRYVTWKRVLKACNQEKGMALVIPFMINKFDARGKKKVSNQQGPLDVNFPH